MAQNDLLKLPIAGAHLFYGDNLDIMRKHLPDECIDLVYLDPPFNSQATYNVLFRAPSGEQSQAQIEAFEDSWHWNARAEDAFDQVMKSGNADAAEMLRSIRAFLKANDMMAYLAMMAVRLLELHRVLKPTGSLYLHCDPTASHYLKLLLDAVFGPARYQNEIIWKRGHAHNSAKRYGPSHDVLLFYTKGAGFTWNRVFHSYEAAYLEKHYAHMDERGRHKRENPTGAGVRYGETGKPWRGIDVTSKGRHWVRPPAELDELDASGLIYWPPKPGSWPYLKLYLEDMKGIPLQDVWTDIDVINMRAAERLGYPTQKPVALLERIVQASSNPGDVVLDPFCGCGTTIHAAQKLGRTWVGIDITHLAISLIEKRLKDAFPGVAYQVHGTPKDLGGAQALAAADKYQFQWWAVSLVDAVPYGGKKKGADGGIDGFIYFKPDGKTTERAIVSVKGGANVGVSMVKDLITTVAHEKAQVGIFITLASPTKPMLAEAAKAGFYEPPHHPKVPRIQILTVEELFAGKKPQIPMIASVFRRAEKEEEAQPALLFIDPPYTNRRR